MVLITNSLGYDLIALVVTSLAGIILYLKWKFSYFARKGLYTPPTTLPFGNSKGIFTKQQIVAELFKDVYFDLKSRGLKHGGAYLLFKPFYIPVDLDIVKSIMQTDFQHFVNHGVFFNEKSDPLSAHLFALEDDRWKSLRAKLTPTFTSGKMKMMFNTLVECTSGLKDMVDQHSQDSTPINIKETLQRFTIDIIGSVAFGIECNSMKNPDSKFVKYGRRIFELNPIEVMKNIAQFTFPHKLLKWLNIGVFNKEVTTFFMEVVKKNVNYRENNNIYRKDFMHLLLQLKNRGRVFEDEKLTNDAGDINESGLTFNELAAQAFVFFLAGYETSSTAMTFALFELSTRPDLQQKIRDEIHAVLEKHDNKLTYDAIKDMTYLEQVIHESLRKYPPVPFLPRVCNKTYKVPGTDFVIEKDTMVGIPVLGIQNDPEIFPNPENFDPDRFSPENKAKRHQFSWIPFGEGPRVCIGLRFGTMQAKVGLVTILQNYKISLNSKTATPIKFDTKSLGILAVDGNVWLNVEKCN
ncbi:probable cytochrome P450 6a14 [Aethina tumida]|uniref:probable cytochrome P450 6a14 n=1 Tax=Aethina tumida TaxID=116153 RepID=UPI002148F7DE|nr:probable cytochrome P450 6a14 [Aethina tumida]XP_049826136.1 probable cytochrome P450 6a14 [Aethina tumida]